MHTVTFYPIGNADTCLIELSNGKRIIFDYANTRNPKDTADKRIDLESEIRKTVGSKKEVDVLALSHLDRDHYQGASQLFWLEHTQKYQSDDRIKIKTLWVPASAILEEGIEDEGKILRAEARHRLRAGRGIRVFSHPDALSTWLRENKISPLDRQHLITDAGDLAPEFSLSADGVEFFVHSPFAKHCEDGALVVRNKSALFMQVRFEVDGRRTHLILSADGDCELIEGIVRATKYHENEDRLRWDINNIPHHCSYRSLVGEGEKGEHKTIPTPEIAWLYEEQGEKHSLLISTSDVIPTEDTTQPPHKQAAAYYKEVVEELYQGEFLVTMREPKPSSPKPMVIEISGLGHRRKKESLSPAIATTTQKPPRAG